MKQIKIFTGKDLNDLETAVNTFLEVHDEMTVKDFRFISTVDLEQGVVHSIMVIYRV
jgi:hypothetical protein